MNALEAKEFGLVDDVLGDTSDMVVITKEGQITFADQLTGRPMAPDRHDRYVNLWQGSRCVPRTNSHLDVSYMTDVNVTMPMLILSFPAVRFVAKTAPKFAA